jgi:HK97 family phage portal protein
MNLFAAVASLFRPKAAPEGAYRDGPWLTMDGVIPATWGQYVNFWQMGYTPDQGGTSAMVEACVSAYAQTIAMCPLTHWRDLANGGREPVTNSALSRVMRAPNDYQTRSDFLLNLVRSLYLEGNAYALALRNNRYEVSSLHLMHPRMCYGIPFEGEIFYALGGNNVIDNRILELDLLPDTLSAVPARDVLHVKLQTPTSNKLRGETPLTAAAMSIMASNAALAQSANFYANMSRPSGVLQTDATLTQPQIDDLRDRWNKFSQGLGAGGTPILTQGLKFEPVTIAPKDTQFVESQKLSDAQIAQVFRIPLALIGSEAQPMGSTEALMNLWISTGLGFALDNIELAIDRTFQLDRGASGEYSELDSKVLMRSAFKDRIEGLARAVQGGIYSPNEARAAENLPAAKDGDEPRVQQQVVPLSFAMQPPPAPTPPTPPAEPKDPAADDPASKMTVSDWNRYFEAAA